MSEEEVPVAVTKPTPGSMYAALRTECRAVLGEDLPRASLLVLMAQWALETATGAASRNFNAAGIKWTAGCGHNFARYLTREVVNGAVVHVIQAFRAYDTLEAGVADYVRVLRHDFAYAWPAVEAADVNDFAVRLKAHRYYTAPEPTYAAGLRARYSQLDILIGPDTVPDLHLSPEAIAQGTDPDGVPWVQDA